MLERVMTRSTGKKTPRPSMWSFVCVSSCNRATWRCGPQWQLEKYEAALNESGAASLRKIVIWYFLKKKHKISTPLWCLGSCFAGRPFDWIKNTHTVEQQILDWSCDCLQNESWAKTECKNNAEKNNVKTRQDIFPTISEYLKLENGEMIKKTSPSMGEKRGKWEKPCEWKQKRRKKHA